MTYTPFSSPLSPSLLFSLNLNLNLDLNLLNYVCEAFLHPPKIQCSACQ
jgi:hypothetical protein